MSELQAKYQKLATEYSKIRAQIPVLKKAVIDEQAKGDQLKDTIKERDQTIRKYEQEIDSLSFRNKQLASRVEVLQLELDESSAKNKKGKGALNFFKATNGSSKSSANTPAPAAVPYVGETVIGQELQSKIEENARLHKQVYESDQVHKETLTELQNRLTVLESEASKHQEVLQATRNHNKDQLDKLIQEKAMLEVKIQKYEKESKETLIRAEAAEERLKLIEADLSVKLHNATITIKDKLPFNDTRLTELNKLNVPTHDRKHQLQAKDLVGQASSLIKELVQSLSNFHTYCEQRSRVYPNDADEEPLSDVNKKFCSLLHENASVLRPVDHSFKAFSEELKEDAFTTLDTATGLQDFAEKFKRYVSYLNKVLPYYLLSIEEECSLSTCTVTLEAKNMEVHQSLKLFVASLQKVESYVSILAAQSNPHCDHPKSSYPHLFLLLAQAVTGLQERTKELSKHYNAKVSLEHQLPTASQKLRTTDECIVSSLVSLVTCTSKISAFMQGNAGFLGRPAGYRTRGSSMSDLEDGARTHPAVSDFRHRAAHYVTAVTKPCPESVPYKVAIHNRKTLFSSTESRESLSQQVMTFQERLGRLEQDKEHWMLESQLMQMKYEKELQKNKDLVKAGGIADHVNETNTISKPRTGSNAPIHIDTSMLGQLDTSQIKGTEGDTREQLIKNHFSTRISDLTSNLQLSDSKALNFNAECRALHKRLSLSVKQKEKLEGDLSSSTQNVAQLKDELQTTTRSYEGQLSMMSEHLAGMNEKLATQKDEIEILKYQLTQNTKSGKKGRLK